MKDRARRRVGCALLAIAVVSGGCMAPPKEYSGFLGRYYGFLPAASGTGSLIYQKRDFDFSRYNRVKIDEVEIHFSQNADRRITETEAKALARMFQRALHRELTSRYPLAEAPGEDVLRIRSALTNLVPASPGGNLFATLFPPALLGSAIQRSFTGVHWYVGQAAVEVEMLDSVSGDRVLAVVDRRAGGRFALVSGLSRWGQTEAILHNWAKRVRAVFDEAHDRPEFVPAREFGR